MVVKSNSIEFIEKAIRIHGTKYRYNLVDYKNNSTKVKIECPIHGHFEQTPGHHLSNKRGCQECTKIKMREFFAKPLEEFIDEVNAIHSNYYDYSKFIYKNALTRGMIICPKHGEFLQSPHAHLIYGCRKCANGFSKGEFIIEKWLKSHNFDYMPQKTFDGCISSRNKKMPFDFYIPITNLCIEFDGRQHFESVKSFGGDIQFLITKENDTSKTVYCESNNIKLLRIPYWKLENIDSILDSYFL